MLDITEATVDFTTPFTQTITVLVTVIDPLTGEETTAPSTDLPTVTPSFSDPGVTVTTSPGTVVISGSYITILPTSWTWLDTFGILVTDPEPPELGTYRTITKVDSPSSRTAICTYAINGDSFAHTVVLPSYTPIANKLKSLLQAVS
jgi:hypothetical protein